MPADSFMARTRLLGFTTLGLLAACSPPLDSTDPLDPGPRPPVTAPDSRFPNAPTEPGWITTGILDWSRPVPFRQDPVYESDNGSHLVDWGDDDPGRSWSRQTALVDDPAVPDAATLEVRLPAGLAGGYAATKIGQHPEWRGTSALLWSPAASTGHLYIGLHVRFSPGYRLNGNVAQKLLYLKSDLPENRQIAHMPFIAVNDGVGGDQLWPAYEPQHPFNRYQVPVSPTNNLNDGRWHRLEMRHAPNVPGQANGTLELWIDGRLELRRNDIVLFQPGQVPSLNRLELNPIFGGGRNPVPADQWIRFGPMLVMTR
jgi:hypothetical protein